MPATGPARTRALRSLLSIVVLVALGAGCGGGASTAAPTGSRIVHFQSTDGVDLDGRLFGRGRVGVVLSHMLPADQSSWYALARTLADRGYLALTYDFRGYCPGGRDGCSSGEKNISAIWQDVVGAVRFLRSQGARDVALIGASMGGTASLVAASQPGIAPTAVITLSAPVSIEGLVATDDELAQVTAAKLFVAGEFDTVAADSAQQLFNASPLPKRVEIFPTKDHGTDLLTGNQGGNIRQLVLTYLAQFVPA